MRWAKTRPHVTYDLASSGLSPVTTAELLGDAAARDAFEISGSNDEGLAPLREAIAARYGVSADCVSIAAGASGANFQSLLALLQPGDDVLIEEPGYDPLVGAARAAGANVVRFERSWKKGFALDPYVVRTALTPATRLIVISNAHNPSGAMASRKMAAVLGGSELDQLALFEVGHVPGQLAEVRIGDRWELREEHTNPTDNARG